MIRAALIGAVLIHPIFFLIAFLSGTAFGANPHFGGGPAVDPVFGWQGGIIGMKSLLFMYVITMCLAPLIISVVGAGLSVGLCLLVRILAPNHANYRVAWDAAGAAFGAPAGTAAVIVVMQLVAFHDFWPGTLIGGVVGAMVGGVLRGMGRWLPQTLGGGLGGAVGGLCAAGWALDPGALSLFDSALACSAFGVLPGVVTAVLVGAVVGELKEWFSPNHVNPEA